MKIQLKTQGGFAFFPALQKEISFNTDDFSVEEKSQIEKLIQDSDFFHLPPILPTPSQAADHYTYTLTIEQTALKHSIQFTEFTQNPALQALRSYLQKKGK